MLRATCFLYLSYYAICAVVECLYEAHLMKIFVPICTKMYEYRSISDDYHNVMLFLSRERGDLYGRI